jgi:hypothetical protein
LLAAIVVAASVVGISAFYRQVIDPAPVEHSPTRLPKTPLPPSTTEPSAGAAAIPLPPPRAVTTGEAPILPAHRARAPELSQRRSMVVAATPPAQPETPPGIGEIPAKAEALPAESASAVAAHAAERSRAGVVVKRPVVVKRKDVHVKHHHRYSGASAQYAWWGWPGGSWTGFPPSGNFRRF